MGQGQEAVNTMGLEMIYFKRCPRCKGDLHGGNDVFGGYLVCLQCGCYLSGAEEAVLLYSYSRRHMALSTRDGALLNATEAVTRAK